MYNFNDNEKKFIKTLEDAKRYVKGKLELDDFEGKWFAMDYREDMESAFNIDTTPYNEPLQIGTHTPMYMLLGLMMGMVSQKTVNLIRYWKTDLSFLLKLKHLKNSKKNLKKISLSTFVQKKKLKNLPKCL